MARNDGPEGGPPGTELETPEQSENTPSPGESRVPPRVRAVDAVLCYLSHYDVATKSDFRRYMDDDISDSTLTRALDDLLGMGWVMKKSKRSHYFRKGPKAAEFGLHGSPSQSDLRNHVGQYGDDFAGRYWQGNE